jgi:integrase
VSDYVAWFGAHRESLTAMRASAEALILPQLGKIEVQELTTAKLRAWHEALAAAPPRLRSAKGKAQRYRDTADDPEAARRRKATANRILTILKAALNHAWREGKIATDEPWRRVKPFHNVDAPRIRYITQAECQRLVNACEPDFRLLVQAALLTGCRYSELTSLTVADFNLDSGTLRIRQSKSGKPRTVYVNEEGAAFFRNVVVYVYGQRRGDELMFVKANGTAWGRSHQARPVVEACERAGIAPAVSFHILRHTYASLLVMAGAPLQVVSRNLGHADTRMTERHYAHLADSYIGDTIWRLSPRLGVTEPINVVGLDSAKRAQA